ncbi:hypothetical protein K470DRAFT_211067 [Piedraia hortae CBS 480.64]|uniref:ER transporter 6TM N-terminal domain-containing protein n=1 Tax=Piedraia hortae CBS 480.64 TaxID=1314780 RepID=A0A6A7C6J3_9PEZI|nr:hypothetical protein K470DRAFT_211067 [Piedraia hortae CBS 480.64]
MQMFKGALAPTIAIACFQSYSFASLFVTIGYLVGVVSILSVAIQPRAKLMQTMLVNVLATCLAAALCLLAMFCVITARSTTGGGGAPAVAKPGTSPSVAYSSSASAVSGVWLFALIYTINAIRCKNPQFSIACTMMAIFSNVSSVYSPHFTSFGQAARFIKTLLQAFLLGHSIATTVSLLVFPLTSRQIFFKSFAACISTLQTVLNSHLEYIHSMERSDAFALHRVNTTGEEFTPKEAEEFQNNIHKLSALHAKLDADLGLAKREIAVGKLGPDDLQSIYRQLRLVLLPTNGLASTRQVLKRVAEERGWDIASDFSRVDPETAKTEDDRVRARAVHEWNNLMKRLREPFNQITQTINDGLEHTSIVLGLSKKKKQARAADDTAEERGDEPRPGDKDFLPHYKKAAAKFLDSKKEMLRAWCAMHGIELRDDFFDNPYRKEYHAPPWMELDPQSPERRWVRRQLFLCLYLEFLLYNISRQVYQLMEVVESLQSSGKLSKSRLIVPGHKRLRKWLINVCTGRDEKGDDQQVDRDTDTVQVYMGQAYLERKDPEHLAARTKWEKTSNILRKVSHFLRSPASAFGFRVACATMSIAVIAFLRDTQQQFITQRLFWAQIICSISMSPSAGQTLRAFMLRALGTVLAIVMSFIAYYIVDGKAAGVLVFFFVFLHVGVWVLLKHPEYTVAGMIMQVTLAITLGYELQVSQIGKQRAVATGQAYYPLYMLGPIRLATVLGGCFVAWIWTIFPYPITEHSQVRKNLGSALYMLANYYSIMLETVRIRLSSPGAWDSKGGAMVKLDKSRRKVFGKFNTLASALRGQMAFLGFDIPIGGKFPRQEYQNVVELMQSAANFMVLVTIASTAFADAGQRDGWTHTSRWRDDFQRIMSEADIATHQITTLLTLFSGSITTGTPLPPYLQVPEPYELSKHLDEIDKDILSVRHIAEPGYSAFALIQLGSRCMVEDVRLILKAMKELVGEMDFSFHIVSSHSNDSSDSAIAKTTIKEE